MNFTSAIDLVKNGQYLHRTGWKRFIKFIGGAIHLADGNLYHASSEDILAEDWKIYEQEKLTFGNIQNGERFYWNGNKYRKMDSSEVEIYMGQSLNFGIAVNAGNDRLPLKIFHKNDIVYKQRIE